MSQTSSVFGARPEVAINYAEHPGQKEVKQALIENFNSPTPAAVVEIICGRGWGKTLFMGCSVVAPFLDTYPNSRVMWVAPTYHTCMSLIEDVFKNSDERSGERFIPEHDKEGNRVWEFVTTKSGPVLKWWNGSTLSLRSADSPDSIVSRGYNLIVIDEACLIGDEKIFTLQIMGTARKAGIKVFMISTPRGKSHWTYKYFLRGQDKSDTRYLSFQQPFTKNPFRSATQEALIKDLPEWLVRQEYMAEFIDDGDTVFKGIENVVDGPEISFEGNQQEWAKEIVDFKKDNKVLIPAASRRFVVGLDLAKSIDYTVLIAMDIDTGEVCYYRRLNKVDYRNVLKIAADICKRYNNAELIFDATGVGAGLSDVLLNYDVSSNPFVFTNESKNDLINNLILSIEHKEITIPNITTIKKELQSFGYTITRTQKVSYGAPVGMHDDIVIALALANLYRKQNSSGYDIQLIDTMLKLNDSEARSSYDSMFLDEDDN